MFVHITIVHSTKYTVFNTYIGESSGTVGRAGSISELLQNMLKKTNNGNGSRTQLKKYNTESYQLNFVFIVNLGIGPEVIWKFKGTTKQRGQNSLLQHETNVTFFSP